MVTALSIAGDLSFNPETDSLTGANGEKLARRFHSTLYLRTQMM